MIQFCNQFLFNQNRFIIIYIIYQNVSWPSTMFTDYIMTIWTTAEHDASPWTLQIIYSEHIMNALYLTTSSDNITINIHYQMNHFDKWCCIYFGLRNCLYFYYWYYFFFYLCLCIPPPTFSPKKNIILTYSQPINNLTSGFITRSLTLRKKVQWDSI